MPYHWKTCNSSGLSIELVDHCSAWPLAVPVFCKHVIYMCTCDQGYSILYARTDQSKGRCFLLVIITNHISFGTTGYTQLSLHAAFCICNSRVSHILLGRLLWVASCAPNVPSPWSSRMAIWFPQAALWMSTLTVLWGMCFCGRWDTISPLVWSNLQCCCAWYLAASKVAALFMCNVSLSSGIFVGVKLKFVMYFYLIYRECWVSKSRSCSTGIPRANKGQWHPFQIWSPSTLLRKRRSLPQSPTLARKLNRTLIWSKPCHCSWLGCSQTTACEWTLQIFWWVIWMFHAQCWELCFAAGSGSWFMNLIICEAQLFAVLQSHLYSLGISHKRIVPGYTNAYAIVLEDVRLSVCCFSCVLWWMYYVHQ